MHDSRIIQQIDSRDQLQAQIYRLQGAARRKACRDKLMGLGRKIRKAHPRGEITKRRILATLLLWAMIGMAGAIVLPLIMGFAFR